MSEEKALLITEETVRLFQDYSNIKWEDALEIAKELYR